MSNIGLTQCYLSSCILKCDLCCSRLEFGPADSIEAVEVDTSAVGSLKLKEGINNQGSPRTDAIAATGKLVQ